MFTGATKIVKPEGQEADEFEQMVAQELFNLEVMLQSILSVTAGTLLRLHHMTEYLTEVPVPHHSTALNSFSTSLYYQCSSSQYHIVSYYQASCTANIPAADAVCVERVLPVVMVVDRG